MLAARRREEASADRAESADRVGDSHPLRRTPRTEAILGAATRLFNRHTFAGMTLDAIAEQIGIAPSTLHYHFPDKDTLVFRCHERGLRLYQEGLAEAAAQDVEGLEQVRRFVRSRLAPGAPRMIAFSDLGSLSPAYRRVIEAERRKNIASLEAMVARGVEDGSIASADPLLTSVGLFSVLDWMPFWYNEHAHYTRHQAAETLDDLLVYGVIRRDHPPPAVWPSPPDVEAVVARRRGAGRREAKRDRLLQVATASFNTRGVSGSSMELIAQDAKVSRNALYYHARDKAGLLYLCLERAFELETEGLRMIVEPLLRGAVTPEVAVHAEVQLHRLVHLLHRTAAGPKSAFHNVNYLSDDQRASVLDMNHAIEARNRSRYENGLESGALRRLDTYFIQQVGAGLRNNVPLWSDVVQGRSALETADNHVSLMLFGLKPRSRPAVAALGQAAETVHRIRGRPSA